MRQSPACARPDTTTTSERKTASSRAIDAARLSTPVQVDEIVRFEGESYPGDEAVLYALDAGDGHRGLYAAAYGADVSAADSRVIRALPDMPSPNGADK